MPTEDIQMIWNAVECVALFGGGFLCGFTFRLLVKAIVMEDISDSIKV